VSYSKDSSGISICRNDYGFFFLNWGSSSIGCKKNCVLYTPLKETTVSTLEEENVFFLGKAFI
jgi:hypothetical protein